MLSFAQTLTLAVRDISRRGYTSTDQVRDWTRRLRHAAQAEMMSDRQVTELVQRALGSIYQREIAKDGIYKTNPEVGRFTIQMLEPQLRAEQSRRTAINIGLIKLNKQEATETMERRFVGWLSSIQVGGSDVVDTRDIKAHIAKPTQQQRYEARRCVIDQGHKFVASLSEIVALGSGAIAGRWRHIPPRAGYQPRHNHVERDGKWYLVRDCWAITEGFVKRGGPYTDEITRPAEEPYCSCAYVWASNLEDLPAEMLTAKGREYVARGRSAAA